jgi:hypothetical protein
LDVRDTKKVKSNSALDDHLVCRKGQRRLYNERRSESDLHFNEDIERSMEEQKESKVEKPVFPIKEVTF